MNETRPGAMWLALENFAIHEALRTWREALGSHRGLTAYSQCGDTVLHVQG
jgi:hypothetical protein